MKSIYQACIPGQAVLDGTADFVVNLSDLPKLNETETREFLDANVLTSGMELLPCPSSPLADHWSPSSSSPAMVHPHLHESADPLGNLRFG